jgi:heat-inducible transcriptional repressor
MPAPPLDDRSRSILKTLVQIYLATGEPVASETLTRRLHHVISSATVRSVMVRLTKLGYLEQPHTSAGRVPTDEGLRVYVDCLMPQLPLSPHDTAAIESRLASRCGSPDEVFESATQLLSQLTGNVGFALAPETGRTCIRHVDFIRLPHPRILVVLVSRAGQVTHRVVEVPEPLSQDQLDACAHYIHAHFAGMELHAIRNRVLEQMRVDKALYDLLLDRLLQAAEAAFAAGDEGGVYLGGAAGLLDQSERLDVARMRALFHAFEERGRLVRILNACLSGEGVRVYIGCERLDPDLKGLTLVTARGGPAGDLDWGLGVMGPTRMEYPRVVALVDQVTQTTRRLLTELNA